MLTTFFLTATAAITGILSRIQCLISFLSGGKRITSLPFWDYARESMTKLGIPTSLLDHEDAFKIENGVITSSSPCIVNDAAKSNPTQRRDVDAGHIRRRVSEEMLPHWRRVLVHYALRLLTAPLIESCILLDRLLFLRENGIEDSWIVPVFDPNLSPRNFAIVALK